MHAILIAENKSLAWSEVPDPVRKDGEIRLPIPRGCVGLP